MHHLFLLTSRHDYIVLDNILMVHYDSACSPNPLSFHMAAQVSQMTIAKLHLYNEGCVQQLNWTKCGLSICRHASLRSSPAPSPSSLIESNFAVTTIVTRPWSWLCGHVSSNRHATCRGRIFSINRSSASVAVWFIRVAQAL